MKNVINIAIDFPHDGKHYKGVTIHEGVSLSLSPAACGVPKTELIFIGASIKPDGHLFLEGVTGANFDSPKPVEGYFQVRV